LNECAVYLLAILEGQANSRQQPRIEVIAELLQALAAWSA